MNLHKRLWLTFLSVYDPKYSRTEMRKKYSSEVYLLNIGGCTGCKINSSFREFWFEVEDLTPEDIKKILDDNKKYMPKEETKKLDTVKKAKAAATKKATTKKAATKKTATKKGKAPVAKKEKAPVAKKIEAPKVKKEEVIETTLPGNIKFLYIPKR